MEFPNLLKDIISILYVFSWVFMAWSMWATGIFRQSGIEEWWQTLRGKKLNQSLLKDGPYRLCRHPIYSAFLGMIWFTAEISPERIFLIIIWTIYIYLGARWKDQRLLRNVSYASYAQATPAFPLMSKELEVFLNLNKGLQ